MVILDKNLYRIVFCNSILTIKSSKWNDPKIKIVNSISSGFILLLYSTLLCKYSIIPQMPAKKIKIISILFITAFIAGGVGVFIKLALVEFPTISFSFIRFFFAFISILPLFLRSHKFSKILDKKVFVVSIAV
jgi:hypothetical protein